jgi:hypothetical protein
MATKANGKNAYGAEQPFGTIVVSQSPGEAPQPLTLNSLGVEPRLL